MSLVPSLSSVNQSQQYPKRNDLLLWAQIHSLLTFDEVILPEADVLPPASSDRLQKIQRVLDMLRESSPQSQQQYDLRCLCEVACGIGLSKTVRQYLIKLISSVREESLRELERTTIP